MQCTSYLPGYYYSRDQTVEASGSLWHQFNNSVFCRSGRDYNILFQPPSVDQYLAYNKEGLRQTMLKHEAVFKYQVNELHRLYGRQRELMDEIKLMELSADHLQMQTSLSNSFVTGMQCNNSKKALQIPSCILLNQRDDNPSSQGAENFQRPLSFASRKSIQSGSDVYLVENHLKVLKASYGKRMLDLELPPEEYIGSDEGERLEEEESPDVSLVLYDPSIKIVDSLPESNLMLKRGASSNFNSNSRKPSCSFDLNEPLQIDESVNTNSTSLVYSDTRSKEIMHQDLDLSGKPRLNTPDLNDIAHDILEGKGSLERSSILGLQIQSAGKSPLPCNDKTILGSKSVKTDQGFFDTNRQRMLTSCMTTSSLHVQLSDQTNAEASSSVSSQRASVKGVPIAIQALPCFNTPQFSSRTSRSYAGSSGNKGKYVCSNTNPACSLNLGRITSRVSCNGDSQFTTEHYSVAKCGKDSDHKNTVVDMDLNVLPSISLPETEDCQEKDRSMDDGNRFENYTGSLNGPRVMRDCEGMQVACPQLSKPPISCINFCADNSIASNSNSTENKDMKIGEMVDVPAICMANDSDKMEKCQKDDTCLATESGKEISKSQTCIDLCSIREQKHSQVVMVTTAMGTDLHAPVSPDNKEHSPPREDSEDNQSEKLEDSIKDLETVAAEAIVSIKLSGEQQCPNPSMGGPLEASFDCLNLFAGIVCSVAGDVENNLEGLLTDAPGSNCNELASNALEHFEAMTFSTKGTKVEDHCYMNIDQQKRITGDIILPCQGQARKATERKEFQSQVLPCASSLSFYDVTENLRPIKELRVAARTTPETVKVRKKVGRVSRAKGGRHSKKFPLNMVSGRACSLSKQNTCESEHSFLQSWSFGWGKKHMRQKHRRARTIIDFGLR